MQRSSAGPFSSRAKFDDLRGCKTATLHGWSFSLDGRNWHFLNLGRSTGLPLHSKTGPTPHDAFDPQQKLARAPVPTP